MAATLARRRRPAFRNMCPCYKYASILRPNFTGFHNQNQNYSTFVLTRRISRTLTVHLFRPCGPGPLSRTSLLQSCTWSKQASHKHERVHPSKVHGVELYSRVSLSAPLAPANASCLTSERGVQIFTITSLSVAMTTRACQS